jgi:tRNA uridine 5-carboxymethylaminomethyl modification enzyme
MFTSRAEHRLLLRQDNADRRLMKYGYQLGLIPENLFEEVNNREKTIIGGIDYCQSKKYHARDINEFLVKSGSNEIDSTETISKLCKRPEFNLKQLLNFNSSLSDQKVEAILRDEKALEQIEIEIKYEGYIQRQHDAVSKLEKYEETKIPLDFDFGKIKQLSTEGREKLNKVKPRSIAQASRISGVTPSDISILLVYLKN